MKKYCIFIAVVIIFFNLNFTRVRANSFDSMQKIWIFLNDKNIAHSSDLEKAKRSFAEQLTIRSIERRKRKMGENDFITYEDIPVAEKYVAAIKKIGVKVRTRSRWLNAISVEANHEQIQIIRSLPFVKSIQSIAVFKQKEPTELYNSKSSSQTIASSSQFHNFDYGLSLEQLNNIRVPEVHDMGLSGKGVLICIMDTGFRKDHEIFQHSNIVAERDFIFNDNDTQTDPNNRLDSSDRHGTLTWSNLGGFKEGKLIGPAFGADFLLAKTENTQSETTAEEDYWVTAVEWADSLGAQVISSSLGYTDWYTFEDLDGNTATITKAADHAARLGIVVITSAGNARTTEWGHINPPADGDSVISVGAFNIYTDSLTFFSSPGPTFDGRIKPEVCASGANNYSADHRAVDKYTRASGTSLSCPLVAGVAALVLEQHPTWSPVDVRNALMYTASQHDHPDNDLGWGVVDAYKAVFDTVVSISVQDVEYNDDNMGNSNRLPEPGEIIILDGILSCIGKIDQSNYIVLLQTDDPFVELSDSIEYVSGLKSYSQVEMPDAFAFAIDPDVPENHQVEFELLIKDELNNSWIQPFTMRVVVQRNITGFVTRGTTGDGIANATVTWTKFDMESNKMIEIDTVRTDGNGKYSLSLVGGKYAVQVSADEYSTQDARIISIPSDSSHLNFNLYKADFDIYPYSFRIDKNPGTEFVENLEIFNTGKVPLFYNIQENIILGAGSDKPSIIPEMLLRSDQNEGIPYDLKGVYCEQDSQTLVLKITTYQEIAFKNQWNLSVYLDTDADKETGYRVGKIGAEYQLSYLESRTELSRYNGSFWEKENFNGITSVGKKMLHFKFQPSLIGNPPKLNLYILLYECTVDGARIVRDIIPSDGGLSNVTFSRYKSDWLKIEKPYNIIPPGSSDIVPLVISFPDSVEDPSGTELILSTNSPQHGETVVPIYLGGIKTEVADVNKLPTSFDLEQNFPNPFNSLTRIRFSLPSSSRIRLKIKNSIGQDVITMSDSEFDAGIHTLYWDGKNDEGVDCSSGIYFISLGVQKWNKIIKAILLR